MYLLLLNVFQIPKTIAYVYTLTPFNHQNELWKVALQLIFTLIVLPFPSKETYSIRYLAIICSSIAMIYGWKYTFIVDEISNLFLGVLCILEMGLNRFFRLEPQKTIDEENKMD